MHGFLECPLESNSRRFHAMPELRGPMRPIGSHFQGTLSPPWRVASLRWMRASPAQNSLPSLEDKWGTLLPGRMGKVSSPSLLQLKCSITGNAQSPGQSQTPSFVMISFSLSLLIKSLKFYLRLTMDKNHLKHLISML